MLRYTISGHNSSDTQMHSQGNTAYCCERDEIIAELEENLEVHMYSLCLGMSH
jgi:hypothetical protein